MADSRTYILRALSSRRADLPNRQYVASADGAIDITRKNFPDTVVVTKGTAAALTLAAPTAGAPEKGGHDGMRIYFVDVAGAAHTLTVTGGFNGAGTTSDVGTFGGAKGDHVTLEAYNGAWYVVDNLNVTLA